MPVLPAPAKPGLCHVAGIGSHAWWPTRWLEENAPMNDTTLERRAVRITATSPRTADPPSRFRWGGLAFLALLAGLLIFCHGCHADVDDELFSHGWWISAV